MPLLVTYESASGTRTQAFTIDMVIVRVPTTSTPKGIAIAQFYGAQRETQS